MRRETLAVSDMSCHGCERSVETALMNLSGVNRVSADHHEDTVEVVVDEGTTPDMLRSAIEHAGYEVRA